MKLYLWDIEYDSPADDYPAAGQWFKANFLIACDFELPRPRGHVAMVKFFESSCNLKTWTSGTCKNANDKELFKINNSGWDELNKYIIGGQNILIMSDEDGNIAIESASKNELRLAKMEWS